MMAAMSDKEFKDTEEELQRKFYSVLRKQANQFIEYANEKGVQNAIQSIDNLIKVEDLRNQYIKVFARQGNAIAYQTFKELLRFKTKKQAPPTLSVGFFSKLWEQYVVGYANTLTIASRITKINETTKKSIKDVIASSPLNGSSRVSLDIRKQIIGINSTRALLIARTELTHINNTAAQFGAEQSVSITGVELEKGWSTRKDGRERPAHNEADGQFVKLNESFVVGGVSMKYPGDPSGGAVNCCNCRCAKTFRPAKRIEIPQTPSIVVDNALTDLSTGLAVSLIREIIN